jgi:ribosomal-protein-alanine N-acetyltransferase
MQAPALRLAVPPEATPIAIMSRALIEQGLPDWSWHPQRVGRAIRASDTSVIVAAHGSAIGGFAIMTFGDTQAHLNLLAVLPSQQRRGMGSRLLAWLEESALVAGIEKINLELRASNQAACCFYRSRGFIEAAYMPNYYQGRETALRMTRDIRRQISDRIR